MQIESVEAIPVRQPLTEPLGFSQWWTSQRTACLVRITTDQGLVGWGECAGLAEVNAAVVREFCGPRLLGRNPLDRAVIWDDLYYRGRSYGRQGPFLAALSGIDLALWDLAGQHFGVPVSTLLGGARCDRVEAYAGGLWFTRGDDLPGRLAQAAEGHVAAGFRALKMKVGLGLARDLVNLRAVRRAIGPDIRLAIDADRAYTARAAIELGLHAALEEVWWYEEPVAPEDLEGCVEVRHALAPHGVALAAGQSEFTRYGFRDLCHRRAVDYLQPELGAAGGLTAGQEIATLASVHGLEVQPQPGQTAVGLAAALHYSATLPDTPGALTPTERWLESDRTASPLRDQLAPGFPALDGPWLQVPDGPGLGLQITDESLAPWCA